MSSMVRDLDNDMPLELIQLEGHDGVRLETISAEFSDKTVWSWVEESPQADAPPYLPVY